MGQKVHPHGFRLGYIYDWNSKWYADRNYTDLLHEDLAIRGKIRTMLPEAGISRVEIERNANQVTVSIYTARPGIVIGRGGQRVDELRSGLEKVTGRKINQVVDVRGPTARDPPGMRRAMLTTIGIPLSVATSADAIRCNLVQRWRRQGERAQILRFVQPSLIGLIDGTISTLAPIFAAAFLAGSHAALMIGLAASMGTSRRSNSWYKRSEAFPSCR